MFDDRLRSLKDRLFAPLAGRLQFVPPSALSFVGLLIGLMAAGALWQGAYGWGFVLCFFNRFFDALDGSVARQGNQQNDLGGYVDILFDFVVYAAVPAGIVFGRPSISNYQALAFLLTTFYVNAASWIYLSAILEKRHLSRPDRLTTVTIPAGIIGGGETILFYALFILFPNHIFGLFMLMATLVCLTIIQRLLWAIKNLP